MLGGIAKDAGLSAVQEAHKAIDGAIPEAQQAGDELLERVRVAINEGAGALERAAGAIALVAGQLPADIVAALDGLTVTGSFSITVKRKEPQE